MSDDPHDGSAETPMQRALRMKKAALDAKATPPSDGRVQRRQTSGVAAGKSKPWMKR